MQLKYHLIETNNTPETSFNINTHMHTWVFGSMCYLQRNKVMCNNSGDISHIH